MTASSTADLAIHATEEGFILHMADLDLPFLLKNDTCVYAADWGAKEPLTDIPHVDFHGLEYLGSARLYIWSRTLPLLPRHILFGTGPDSFCETYPQNDYAGKAIYADRTDRVIESGHNDLLTKWIQTGGLSVVCLMMFYFLFLQTGFRCLVGHSDSPLTNQTVSSSTGHLANHKSNSATEHLVNHKSNSMTERLTNQTASSPTGHLVNHKSTFSSSQDQMPLSRRLARGCFLACISYLAASLFHDSSLQAAPMFWVFAGIAASAANSANNAN